MPLRKSRAAAACNYCRDKKLKCDAQKPTCGHCAAKGIDCQQGPIRHKPRPTNRRIAQLERENALLRQQGGRIPEGNVLLGDEPSMISTDASFTMSPSRGQVELSISQADSSPIDRPTVLSNGSSHPEAPDSDHLKSATSLYHGPTSAVYDDTEISGNNNDSTEWSKSPMSEEWTRSHLFAETAKQRQLELLNFSAGKLDFDGFDPEIGMHLLSIYWCRQLYTAQIIYRPAFMRDMACNGPYFSKLLLNAILFTVSKHCARPELRSDPDDIKTAGWSFRQRFTELLRDSFDKSDITTLQALLIMSNSLFSRCDERSLSWLYAGNAFNMIIDLGLHVLPSPSKMSPEDLEIRKRVVWGAYSIDKIQCLYQGRPPLLRYMNFKAPLNFLDDYDELDPFQEITYTPFKRQSVIPSLNVSLLTKLCELSIIIDRILCELYSESQEMSQSQSQIISDDINSELGRWRRNLPPQLDYLSHPSECVLLPQAFCLLALFDVLIILSQRPLFTGSYGQAAGQEAAYESVNVCTTAANQIVQILRDYSQHFSISSAPYMLSYATYISATIHARVVAQKGRNSNSYQSLLLCRTILKEHQCLYAAAGKARANLNKLVQHLKISITEGDEQISAPVGNSGNNQFIIQEPLPAFGASNLAPQTMELQSPQLNWELSDLDLEAIAEGFRLGGELDYLMRPSGI
ncbi:uncharacterized protein N7484_001152 [Penicillium longicatenatum]|uniref:uncharacterized protein n=1 Tax=Penicillium longicatenatum TaxID=1561947 RepID=UPI0025472439|nr:uncharacterized protein N7484_001152 [Penicillium longicatenatum]KAJ5657503.1 hypothetical protein N7484_001152 [Penicillium longicatenatum]